MVTVKENSAISWWIGRQNYFCLHFPVSEGFFFFSMPPSENTISTFKSRQKAEARPLAQTRKYLSYSRINSTTCTSTLESAWASAHGNASCLMLRRWDISQKSDWACLIWKWKTLFSVATKKPHSKRRLAKNIRTMPLCPGNTDHFKVKKKNG